MHPCTYPCIENGIDLAHPRAAFQACKQVADISFSLQQIITKKTRWSNTFQLHRLRKSLISFLEIPWRSHFVIPGAVLPWSINLQGAPPPLPSKHQPLIPPRHRPARPSKHQAMNTNIANPACQPQEERSSPPEHAR